MSSDISDLFDAAQLSRSQNPSLSFGMLLIISLLNSYYSKKRKKKKTDVSLYATLQSHPVAFEVMTYQFLCTADRHQSHFDTIPPFLMLTAEQTEVEEKVEIQNKMC